MSERVVVYVTAPTDKARELAGAIVAAELAACVNIVPSVRSIYRWQGEVCDDEESLLIIKSTGAAFEALRARVVDLHPYDVPEVIALPIEAGHGAYLDWLDESVSLK